MDISAVLNQLKAEQRRIDAAITALESLGGVVTAPARPSPQVIAQKAPKAPKAKKRHLSPEGRARIIAATKARWAKFNAAKAPKASAKKARVMSPAARRKIAAAARARWAKIKAAKK